MGVLTKLCFLILASSCLLAVANAALSCGTVTSKVSPCLAYLTKGGASPPAACCAGVKQLNGMAQTTPDRQQACRCLQTIARSIPGLKAGLAASLPSSCNVNVPFPISLSTNCNSVK